MAFKTGRLGGSLPWRGSSSGAMAEKAWSALGTIRSDWSVDLLTSGEDMCLTGQQVKMAPNRKELLKANNRIK